MPEIGSLFTGNNDLALVSTLRLSLQGGNFKHYVTLKKELLEHTVKVCMCMCVSRYFTWL